MNITTVEILLAIATILFAVGIFRSSGFVAIQLLCAIAAFLLLIATFHVETEKEALLHKHAETTIVLSEETSPADKIPWREIQYEKTSDGYEITYNTPMKSMRVVETDKQGDASHITDKKIRYVAGWIYGDLHEYTLVLSATDYQKVVDWIEAQEQKQEEIYFIPSQETL